MIGSKATFGIDLEKDAFAYQLSVYVHGNDILQFEKEGIIYTYRWKECQDIIEWIQKNMKHILRDDKFPLSISAGSAAENCKLSYDLNINDIQQYEILQDWMFRHSWFSARAGSYLADIYFVKKGNMIELSWDNTSTFQKDVIRFIFPKGNYKVDIKTFEKTMKEVCKLYRKL